MQVGIKQFGWLQKVEHAPLGGRKLLEKAFGSI